MAASRYSRPWFLTRVTISSAMAPVAAEIIPGRPPTKAITTAIQKEAYRPTLGSTPAMIEKAMASGMRARATTRPARMSPRMLENQVCFNEWSIRIPKAMDRAAQHGAGHVQLVDTRSNCRM
ncbi:hypothetical protein D3C84_797840 [compost metagenome]